MADIRVIFNDKKELQASSYTYSKYEEKLILRFSNPKNPNDIISFLEDCDKNRISLLAKYPNREKELVFINYKITLSFFSCLETGAMLEVYFEKI